MNKIIFHQFGLKFLLLLLLATPQWIQAQYFTDTDEGDVVAGFRKTGGSEETYEMVAYLGNITNFLLLAPGTVTNITNYKTLQLSNMCPDNFNHLQWSVFSSFNNPSVTAGTWVYTNYTSWFTVARTKPGVQTTPPSRSNINLESDLSGDIVSVSDGAYSLASQDLGATNVNDNTLVLLEPTTYDPPATEDTLTAWIGDYANSADGDFNPNRFNTLNFSVENNTSNFTSAVVSDFYQDVPTSSSGTGTFTDPNTGLTNGSCYFVGYFTLSTSGSMTFTRASLSTAPLAGSITSTVTNGFSPLSVIFTNSATGSITNWVWNFGDGTIVTNTTGANVSHTYSTSGTYSVTLTVEGPGGSSSVTNTAFIVSSSTPKIKYALLGTNFIISGTNCPINVQYRILGSTNLASSASWVPIFTNKFLSNTTFSYTNVATNKVTFLKLVSP